MRRVLVCECGEAIESSEEAALIAGAQSHGLDAHGLKFSAEQILALARPVIANETTEEMNHGEDHRRDRFRKGGTT